MTTEERIANIGRYASGEAQKKQDMLDIREAHRVELVNAIKALGPRIGELAKVATALVNNGVHLGKYMHGSESREFVTEGIDHRIGFYINDAHYPFRYKESAGPMVGGLPLAFGIAGGGCCGESLKIDFEGNIIAGNTYEKMGTMQRLINGFDEFENKFYNYVDSL